MITNLVLIGGRKKVNRLKVEAFVADSNYSRVYMVDGNEHFVATTLGIIENRLDTKVFVRTHRSSIINLKYLKKIDLSNLTFALLKNNLKVTISRRKKGIFLEKLGLYTA